MKASQTVRHARCQQLLCCSPPRLFAIWPSVCMTLPLNCHHSTSSLSSAWNRSLAFQQQSPTISPTRLLLAEQGLLQVDKGC